MVRVIYQSLGCSVDAIRALGPEVVFSCLSEHPAAQVFPVAQTVKNLPAVQETGVQSLGWEGPLEKEMATHSSILVWEIPWTEELSRL